jgi:hypothetical protein
MRHAQHDGSKVVVQMCVSSPLEDYDPTADSTTRVKPHTAYSVRKPISPTPAQAKHRTNHSDSWDSLDTLGLLLKHLGWKTLPDAWIDAEDAIYPPHFETILAALTDLPRKNALVRGLDYCITDSGNVTYLTQRFRTESDLIASPLYPLKNLSQYHFGTTQPKYLEWERQKSLEEVRAGEMLVNHET